MSAAIAPDFAVVGGGIAGVATAAFLSRAGGRVELYERDRVAAAASGRNSGAIQHPYDGELAALHRETLDLYAALEGFDLPPSPAGVLLLASDHGALATAATALAGSAPELRPELKRRGFLSRDARVKERRKAGLKKARKRPQFSKR